MTAPLEGVVHPSVARWIREELEPFAAEGVEVQRVWDEVDRFRSRDEFVASVLEDQAERDRERGQ